MGGRGALLTEVMRRSGTTQSELSRLSGVRQPSISQILSGTIDPSERQLDRLLACMGYQLEVTVDAVEPDLTRSEWRSWRLHRKLSIQLGSTPIESWRDVALGNIERLRGRVTGQPHERNLDEWQRLLNERSVTQIQRVCTGLDRTSIEMREVSPFSGLLSESDRLQALRDIA